jgi:acyl carrier protein
MELQKFVQLFSEQFEDSENVEFTSETIFKEIEEWDSLTALTIIAMVDEELEKRITGADIRNCNTIEDLHKLIMLI